MSNCATHSNERSDHIGYKKLKDVNNKECLIAELLIIGKHNENRSDVAVKEFAMYRCSEAFVNRIYHMDTKEEVNHGCSTYDPSFKYVVGQTVKSRSFDDDLEVVSSAGIHYFLSEQPAYYYTFLGNPYTNENNQNVHDKFKRWFSNGNLWMDCTFAKNKLNGECKEFYPNGNPKKIHNYKNGVSHGKYELWWGDDGQKTVECYYDNDKLCGEYKTWNEDGLLNVVANYKDGLEDGKYRRRLGTTDKWCVCEYEKGQIKIH